MRNIWLFLIAIFIIIYHLPFFDGCSRAIKQEAKPTIFVQTIKPTENFNDESIIIVKAASWKLRSRKAKPEETGRETVCPVTNNKFYVTRDTDTAEYKGRIYFFCSLDCLNSFLKKPDYYINK